MRTEQAVQVARSNGWLSQFDRRTQDLVLAPMRLVNLPRSRKLFEIEDSASDIYCMVSGSAVITIAHPVQGVLNAHVILPGCWFGEPAALGRRPRIMSIVATQNCELLTLSRQGVTELLASEPSLNWVFFNLMAYNVEQYLHHAVDLLISDPRLRFCSRLLTFAGRLINYLPPSPVTIPMTQEELAVASNMSRSTVHQLLADLVAQGICDVGYREIVIRDVERLSAIVNDAV
jgi:CRP-like cAMP-binding protein